MSLFICVCQKTFTLISLSPSYFLEQENIRTIINVLTNEMIDSQISFPIISLAFLLF